MRVRKFNLTRYYFWYIIWHKVGFIIFSDLSRKFLILMPGRLMVGRMTLDHVVEGSNPSPAVTSFKTYLALSSRG